MNELLSSFADIVIAGSLLLGAFLMLLAAVGLIRLPDLPTRMHASTKAGSLGAALTMLAVAVFLPEPAVIARAVATVAFLLLTAPVAAHAIGRAAYFCGVPLWEGTVKDDLAGHYDHKNHTLRSGEHAAREIEGLEPPSEPEEEKERPVPAGPEAVKDAVEPEALRAPKPGEAVSDPDFEPEDERVEPSEVEEESAKEEKKEKKSGKKKETEDKIEEVGAGA